MSSVSVIIPVYNVEKYLDECVISIIKELKPQDEIILINDGSKDNSLEICKKYEADNVVVIDNENHGVSYSRNCGVEIAKGDYVTFVDSDDYLLSGWRETVGMGMKNGTDIVYFGDVEALPSKKDIVKDTLCIPLAKPLKLRASACWYKLFKLDFVKQNNIKFNSDLINGEDGMFCLDTLLCGANYSVQKAKNFYYYRTNNASATHTFNEKYNASNLKFISLLREKLTKSDIFTPEETQKYVDFLDVNGLCILAGRIAKINDLAFRKTKYALFEQSEYINLYNTYVPDELLSKRKYKIFTMLKEKQYDKAMKIIIRRGKIVAFLKRILH